MFGSLKKKLQDALAKVSGKIGKAEVPKPKKKAEEPSERLEAEIEEHIEELKEVEERVHEEHIPGDSRLVAEEARELEEAKKEAGEIREIKEKRPKRGLLKRIVEKTLSESDIETILKELELALLESDVAVDVAERIGAYVKSALLGKAVRRGKTEEMIRTALRSAILNILEQPKMDLEKKIEEKDGPFLITAIGFNGTGKCVSGDTLIPQPDGSVTNIAELYEQACAEVSEKPIEDGFVVEKTIPIFSINPYTLEVGATNATHIWKLKKNMLLKVVLENGQEIKVTPEHPFFILRPGAIEQKRADEIAPGDYTMVPKCLHISAREPSKLDILRILSNRRFFIRSPEITSEAYKAMERLYGSLKKAYEELSPGADWMTFRYFWKASGKLPSNLVLKLCEGDADVARLLAHLDYELQFGRSRPIKFPDINETFYAWLGLFYAEGHLEHDYIDFTNTDDAVLEDFVRKTLEIFGVRSKIKPDTHFPHVKCAISANRTLAYFVNTALGVPMKKKSSGMALPAWLLRCSDAKAAAFIRHYWACDGCVNRNSRTLEAATASEIFSRQLSQLLLRFGIIASRSKRIIKGKPYYRVYICGKGKIRTFADRIGIADELKQKRLDTLLSLPEQFERTELLPLQADYIRKLRCESGIAQQEFANRLDIGTNLLCQYERSSYNVAIPLEMAAKIAKLLSSRFLSTLSSADVRWARVKAIEPAGEGDCWVYDLTVPLQHNFVANNFVVHNTTTLAKLAHKFKHFKPVLAAGDTFRAASIEQLEEHGRRLGVKVIKHRYGADSAAVIFDAVKHAKAASSKLVLADTAGRSHANVNLMDELKKVIRVNKPDLKVLVLDALAGNDIYDQARLFDQTVGVDAVILTKADVYDKGGAALSAAYTLKKPILFLGVGQEYKDLQPFDAKKIVESLLG